MAAMAVLGRHGVRPQNDVKNLHRSPRPQADFIYLGALQMYQERVNELMPSSPLQDPKPEDVVVEKPYPLFAAAEWDSLIDPTRVLSVAKQSRSNRVDSVLPSIEITIAQEWSSGCAGRYGMQSLGLRTKAAAGGRWTVHNHATVDHIQAVAIL